MNCPNCGREVKETERFCVVCGTQVRNVSDNTNTNANTNTNDSSPTMDAMNDFAGKMVNSATNSLMGISKSGINFMVRRYFFGFGEFILSSLVLWIAATVLKTKFGSPLSYYGISGFAMFFGFLQVVAINIFLISIGLGIYIRLIGGGKNAVDEATGKCIAKLEARARQKFNVDIDQIKEIDPIIISGAGTLPKEFVMRAQKGIKKHVGLVTRLYSKEPVAGYKAGHDGITRYLLLQTTFYVFTDTQLLSYTGNIDISTGIIYEEAVSEIFYKDINSMTQKDVLKKCKTGIFKNKYYTTKYLELDICGCTKEASFDDRLAKNANISLAGMQSFIREKKY